VNPTPAVSNPALDGISQRARNHVTRHLMPFLFLVYVVAYIDRNNIGFAGLQMTGELGFSDSVFGLGSGIFFAGYTILGIPGAMLVEKWSARRTLAATMFVWGLVASATGFIHTQTEFYSMRFLLGVAEAAFFPGIITYLGHWYRLQDRAKAVAMFMAAIPVSQAIAAPLSAGLMRVHWMGLSGWRWLLILEGAPAVVCAVVSMFYLTDRPRDAQWLAKDERDWLAEQLERESEKKTAQRKMSFWNALAHKDILLLCLVYFGGTVGNYGLNLWMPKIIQKLAHLSVTDTALVSAIPAIAAIPLMFLCGWHSDKTGERRWHTALPRVIAGLAMAVLTIPGLGLASVLFWFSVAFAGIVAAYPPLWAIPNTFLGNAAAAASIGLISSIGNLGGFAGPYVIGYFSDKMGNFQGGLWAMAVTLVLCGFLVLVVKKHKAPA
jgi:ACS family tartrate transporter-like MFS transporter